MVQKNNYHNFLQQIIGETNRQTNYDDADYDSYEGYYNRTEQEEFFIYQDESTTDTIDIPLNISVIVQEEDVQPSSNFYKYIMGMIIVTSLSVSLSYFLSKKRNKKIN
tara:strand:+ start:607 stop:930 length:324 start_codon:yes stop_codon:yes gene_type:complete